MELLNSLIKDAANQFQCHNYNTALELYNRCLRRCQSQQSPKYVLNNLKSSTAALYTILGRYDQALSLLNSVLQDDKQHWLSLMRRSQVYKKKLELKKAIKDLDTMRMYTPDNLHVAALKLEIKGLMTQKEVSSSSESEQCEEGKEQNEEELLKFSNLKKIDRTSVSIMLTRGRQSRVTICGDIAVQYDIDIDEEIEKDPESYIYSPKIVKQKFIEICQQLQEAETQASDKEQPVSVIKSKDNGRNKSILRNRDSKIYIAEEKINNSKEQAEKMINKLQDVEGKVLKPTCSLLTGQEKQVGFRKSIYASQEKQCEPIIIKKSAKQKNRKSCLKRTSFTVDVEQVKKGPRRSKFDSMRRESIDGKFIPASKEVIEVHGKCYAKDNQSDEGSQYNIFGDQEINLTKEIRENFGIQSGDFMLESSIKNGQEKERGRSILKKNSILKEKKKKVSIFVAEPSEEEFKVEKKAKKSVMFMNY